MNEKMIKLIDIPSVSVKKLHKRLGLSQPLDYPQSSMSKPLTDWKMEIDDSPIFRYLYRNFKPKRHLEFGTWEGQGLLYCLEESEATVWTINILEGEVSLDGSWSYSSLIQDSKNLTPWVRKKNYSRDIFLCQTDSLGFIGRYYREKGFEGRVCQIYSDSRDWDISNYPEGFFDTILIDGGHFEETVINDTRKALKLLRSGGLLLWHDFCPMAEVFYKSPTVRGVVRAVESIWENLASILRDCFWIEPSWILLGVKK